MLEWEETVCKQIRQNELRIYASSIMEPAHAKSHAQTASVRKAANDQAREDRAIARDYQNFEK